MYEQKVMALQSEDNFYSEILNLLSKPEFDCQICLETLTQEKIVVTDCLHSICVDCYEKMRKSIGFVKCATCRAEVF
jgi:hypothetical protein